MKMESVAMHLCYHNYLNIKYNHKDKVDIKIEDNLGSEWWKILPSSGSTLTSTLAEVSFNLDFSTPPPPTHSNLMATVKSLPI